jgi:hypothetical protein
MGYKYAASIKIFHLRNKVCVVYKSYGNHEIFLLRQPILEAEEGGISYLSKQFGLGPDMAPQDPL